MTYSSSGSKTSRSRLETSLRRRKKSKCNSSNVTELRKADKRVSKQKEIIKNLVEDIPSAVRSIFRDDMMSEVFEKISEHKIAEEALRLERDIVQKYINAAGVMIMVIGADRKVKLINKKGCKILGYNEDEIVGKDWVENFLPKHIHEQIKVVEEKLKAGDISDIEHLKSPVLTKSGEERIISWHNALLWDDEGMPSAVLSTGEDITEQKKTEEALRESEERFFQVTANAQEWLWEVDPDGLFIYVSPSVTRIVGYTPKEIIGKKYFYDFFHPEDREQMKKASFEAFAKKRCFRNFINRNVHKDGKTVWLSTSGAPILDKEGNLIGYRGADTDITEERLAEEAYRGLVDNSIQGLAIIQDGQIVFFNKAFRLITGYDEQELLGLSSQMLIHPDDREMVLSRHQDRLAGKPVPARYEFRSVRKDGSTAWLEIHARKVEYQGHPATQAAFIDITERKKAEEALEASKEFAEKIIETANVIVVFIGPDGNINTFNKFAEELTGYQKKDVLGKNWFDIFIPENEKESVSEVFKKVLDNNPETSSCENYIVTKNGEKRLIRWNNHSILDNKGKIIGDISIGIDITECKKAEEQIKEQHKFLNNILESMSHPFIVIDADNYNIKVANAAAKRTMLSEETTCHMFSHKLDRPCDCLIHICPLREIKKTGRSVTVEHVHYDNNGNPRYIELHSHPVFDDRGNISDVIEYFIDITERKLAEEQAEQHKAEFIHVSRLSTIGEMASGLAHELNQPLCAILSCSELCLQNTCQGIKNPELLNENLKTIATQAERAGNIIHRIRGFVQKQDTPREPVDINNLIQETLNFINTDIKHGDIKVNIDIPKKLPKVMADDIQIEQVLINLLLNAIEAMADTDVEKRSLTIKASEDSNNIKVMVRDNGHGLIPEIKKQLFNPFFSTKPDGLGIGLSISHSIIEAHNGEIWAKPNPDCGSTFAFTLPVA